MTEQKEYKRLANRIDLREEIDVIVKKLSSHPDATLQKLKNALLQVSESRL